MLLSQPQSTSTPQSLSLSPNGNDNDNDNANVIANAKTKKYHSTHRQRRGARQQQGPVHRGHGVLGIPEDDLQEEEWEWGGGRLPY